MDSCRWGRHQRGTIGLVALVWVLLAILVLGGVAVVAAGRGQGLTAPEPDRPTLALPPDRPLTRYDVDRVRFSVGLRGYRMDEVDDVLDRLAVDLESRDARIAVLEQEVAAKWTAGPPGDAGPARPDAERAQEPEAEPEQTSEAEPEPAGAPTAEPVTDDDVLVERTLIVPFQQTDSRFAPPPPQDDQPSGPGA